MSRYLFLLMITAAVFIAACNSGDQPSRPGKSAAIESRPAPELVLSALDGSSQKLSDLKGKVVLLNFWATWCPPCREEIPSMMRLNSIMEGKPFQMLAVSVDEGGKQAVRSFFDKYGYALPAYIDGDNKASTAYGVSGVPETYIIDRKGVIVKRVIGPLAWDDPEVISYLNNLMK